MFSNPKYPILAPHGFLERAFLWLETGMETGIFYASLDLRFTFERILIKHGFASTNDTKSFEKLKSQPKELHQALQKEFLGRLDIGKSYKFFLGEGHNSSTVGYFLSIPEDLFSPYGRLDNYLHAQWAIPIGTPDRRWYKEASAFLFNFANTLIPHANPDNSLDYMNIPSVKIEEVDGSELENMMRDFWR
jgi:hypothetical protein